MISLNVKIKCECLDLFFNLKVVILIVTKNMFTLRKLNSFLILLISCLLFENFFLRWHLIFSLHFWGAFAFRLGLFFLIDLSAAVPRPLDCVLFMKFWFHWFSELVYWRPARVVFLYSIILLPYFSLSWTQMNFCWVCSINLFLYVKKNNFMNLYHPFPPTSLYSFPILVFMDFWSV